MYASDRESQASAARALPSRGGLVARGTFLLVAVVVGGVVILLALTFSIMERQQYWCDDCPDLAPAVYATDDRYVGIVLALAAAAIVAAAGTAVVSVVRRSRRALGIGALIAGALMAGAAGAALLHWVRY